MKLKGSLIGAITVAVMLQMGAVQAFKAKPAVNAKNKDDFTAVVAAVHKEMLPGGRYDLIDQKERSDVDSHLTDMQTLFDKYNTVDQMDPNDKIRLFNDQEAVNATLTRRDNKRLICQSIAPVGSHIPRTTCITYGQKMQQERQKVRFMDDMKHVQNGRPGGG